jgi:cytochrome P450
VIYEGLRFHPPVFEFLPKVVPKGGDTLDGKFVPGGTQIAINTFSLGRHKPTFGDDADVFRPERWLEADTEHRAAMKSVAELEFGYGRFKCAGSMLALLELNKIFFEV